MLVAIKSPFSGIINELDIDVNEKQLALYYNGDLIIQNAFPKLCPCEREFIHTGITPQEWTETFGKCESIRTCIHKPCKYPAK